MCRCMVKISWLATLLLGLGTLACSSDDDRAGKDPPTLDGMIHSFVIDELNLVVPGVEICVVGQPDIPCGA